MTTVLDINMFAEVLFASDLQRSQHPSTETVLQVLNATVERHGEDWCTAQVAQEFGEHPDCACRRMEWAIALVEDAFA